MIISTIAWKRLWGAAAQEAGLSRGIQADREVPLMLPVLRSRTYRHLFIAQAIALAGTGLLDARLSRAIAGIRDELVRPRRKR
jgi:hypothetical protein